MKLYSKMLDTHMEMDEHYSNNIIMESPQHSRNVISNIITSVETDSDDWLFYEAEKEIKKSKSIEIVHSLFALELNSKKVLTGIINEVVEIAANEQHYQETDSILQSFQQYLVNLEFDLDYNVELSQLELSDLIKIGMKGIDEAGTLPDQLDTYIKISSRILKRKILVLYGIQQFFCEEEWRLIEKSAYHEGLYLLCIESMLFFESNNKIIFDKDWCRVV